MLHSAAARAPDALCGRAVEHEAHGAGGERLRDAGAMQREHLRDAVGTASQALAHLLDGHVELVTSARSGGGCASRQQEGAGEAAPLRCAP